MRDRKNEGDLTDAVTRMDLNRKRERYGRWGILLERVGKRVLESVGWGIGSALTLVSLKERERVSTLFDPWRGEDSHTAFIRFSIPFRSVAFSTMLQSLFFTHTLSLWIPLWKLVQC